MLMLVPASYRFTPWEPQPDTSINGHMEIMELSFLTLMMGLTGLLVLFLSDASVNV